MTKESRIEARSAAELTQLRQRVAELENLEKERKKAEADPKEAQERFRATFDQAAVGIAHVDLNGALIRANDRICEILGRSREELLGKTYQELTHPDDLAEDEENVRRMLDGEIDTYTMEKRYLLPDGETVWGRLTAAVVREKTGEPKYVISVVENISDRKRAEAEIERAKDELERRVAERTAELLSANEQLRCQVAERERAERRVRQLSLQLINAQEEERRRLALDLHDETGQLLSALKIGLHALAQGSAQTWLEKQKEMARLMDLCEDVLARIQTMAYMLRPAILDRFGLVLAIQDLVEWVADSSRIEIRTDISEFDESLLPDEAKTTLFRFIQEGLTNAVRHSGSRRIEVRLCPEDGSLKASVKDFGQGFNVEKVLGGALTNRRLGLVGMIERLELSGGGLTIDSSEKGTTLRAEIPLGARA